MYNIAVLDDDEEFVSCLSKYIEDFFSGINEKCNIFKFYDGVSFLEKYSCKYDMVFMDIDMPYMNGIEIARRLRLMDTRILLIFVTRMSEFAINGYDVSAFDFIVKPIEYYAFSLKMKRAVSALRKSDDAHIVVGGTDNIKVLSVREICYVEVFKHDIIYHVTDGTAYHHIGTLKEVSERLGPYDFVLAQRCYLVNLMYVEGVNDDYVVCDGNRLKIGRTYKKSLLKSLADYYNA